MDNGNAGASTRQLKVAKELQKDLAEIIRSKGMAMFGGAMVYVTEVRIFPSSKAEAAMQIIDDNARAIRGELGRLVAKQFRIVPELVFYQDSTLDYVEHIDELLKK